jgi:hypothetical protein
MEIVMVNHTNSAIDNAENSITGKRTRGGPRSKYFFCIEWKKKIYEVIEASSSEEASDAFENLHQVKPNVIDGGQSMKDVGGGSGYYLAKGTGMVDSNRISVTVSAEQMTKHTTTHVKAQFRGWIVYGNGIKGFIDEDGNEFQDDELVTILFHAPADPNNKQPKPKLKKNEAIHMNDLEVISKS